MNSIPKNSNIVVAVRQCPEAIEFLSNAFKLCEKLSCNLVLAHITEPFNDSYMHTLYGIPGHNAQITKQIDEERSAAAKTLLEKEALNAPANLHVEIKTVIGYLEPSLNKIVEETNAAALIIGSKTKLSWGESSFSNSISIIEKSNTPVIIIPYGFNYDLTRAGLSLLVCDDLSYSGTKAVNFARAFSKEQPSTKVKHLNIIDNDKINNPEEIDKLFIAISPEYAESNPNSIMKKAVQTELTNRFSLGFSPKELEQSSYESVCLVGNTLEKISEYANETKIDITVFGEHSFIKLSPFGRGKISWKSMMSFGRPVLICKGN
jgi:nucleotide-binding universal stress UspA family protein